MITQSPPPRSLILSIFLLSVFHLFSLWYTSLFLSLSLSLSLSHSAHPSLPPFRLIPSLAATKRLKRDYSWHVNVMRLPGIVLFSFFFFFLMPYKVNMMHTHTHTQQVSIVWDGEKMEFKKKKKGWTGLQGYKLSLLAKCEISDRQ